MVPPLFAVVKLTVVEAPLQTTIFAGILTCPSGLTVIVNDLWGPGQSVPPFLNTGVTVIVPVTGDVVVLVVVNEIFPVPLAPSPIAVLLLVQL